jgi:Homeodomain-like domain-containing protein
MHHIYTDEEMLRRLKRPPGIASFWALRHFEKLLVARRRELLLQARRAGWSWYDLAVALGVSRQAVQQQWRRLVAPEPEPDD